MNEKSISFIGLGGMGAPMAGLLLKAWHKLRVFNRSADKMQPLVAQGAEAAASAADAVTPGGIVVTMLTNDAAVEEVAFGKDGFAERLGPGGIHLSTSTISAELSRELARCHAEYGSHYVASPVLGKPNMAEAKKLWILSSGPSAARERVRSVQMAMGQGIYDFGEDPGAANVAKLIVNFMIGGAIEAMAEGFTLAQKSDIARQQIYELVSQTVFNCPIYVNYGKMIAEEYYQPVGGNTSLIRKDIGLILQAAKDAQVPMPLAGLVHDRMTATVAKGRDDMDWTGFAREVSDSAGVGKP